LVLFQNEQVFVRVDSADLVASASPFTFGGLSSVRKSGWGFNFFEVGVIRLPV